MTITKDCGSANMLLLRFRLASELNTATVKNLAKSIYPSANPFTKISLTHGGVEIPQTPLVAPADTYDHLMRAFGLRDDNNNGSVLLIMSITSLPIVEVSQL